MTTSAGSLALLDTGDVIKIAFGKEMQTPVGRQMFVRDADGTIADIRCCRRNTNLHIERGSGDAWRSVVPGQFRDHDRDAYRALGVAAGSSAGLQLNVTVTSGSFVDIAGNTWDIPGSDDVILGAPD